VPKIAIIGPASVVFTRRLLGDALSFPSLADSKIALMDIDAERLELISGLANRLVTDSKIGAQRETTADRAKALEGADFVITTIPVGDDDDVARGIPRRLGIDQAVGDTIGPGGIIKALRTVPALLDICHDMGRLFPHAWSLNTPIQRRLLAGRSAKPQPSPTSACATAFKTQPANSRSTSALTSLRCPTGRRE